MCSFCQPVLGISTVCDFVVVVVVVFNNFAKSTLGFSDPEVEQLWVSSLW